MQEPVILPRVELREEAFRRYEPYIVKASFGSCTIDPKPMKAHSFICRFRDAIRGLSLYNYETDIPQGTNLQALKCYETANGMVYIKNESTELKKRNTPAQESSVLNTSSREVLTAKLLTLIPSNVDMMEVNVTFVNATDHSWFADISPDIYVHPQDVGKVGPCRVYLMKPNETD